MTKITYTDKVSAASTGLPAINTWRDNDANEVKNIVNNNDTMRTSTSNTVTLDDFSRPTRYGTWATPITGTITLDDAGAVEGGTAVMIWSGSSNPTFDGDFTDLYNLFGSITASGLYSIYFHYINGQININIYGTAGTSVVETSPTITVTDTAIVETSPVITVT